MAKRFGVMLDMSRNAVMRPEQVKEFAATIKKMGYNMIQLYTEDTYEIPEEPYFGYLRGRYSKEEMKDIVAYCGSIGVEIIPCIQTLAHLNQAFMWARYQAINDTNDILMVDDPRTYEFIENMFKTLRECFTTEYIHVGMDEAHNLGLGRHLDKYGYENRFDILSRHLKKVIALAEKYNFKPMMWSDMFFRLANHGAYYVSDTDVITDEVIAACPEGIDLVYWDYYADNAEQYDTMLKAHDKFGRETWVAGGAWTWTGFASNNDWTLDTMSKAVRVCANHGVENIFMTMWGDNGKECSFFSVLPSLYAIRRMYDGVEDLAQIKREFSELMGEDFDAMMLLDLPVNVGAPTRKDKTFHKYMLYSDPILGYLDTAVKFSAKEGYEELAARLEAAAANSKYGYIFESQAALCRALALKHDLGVRTRAAYRSGDKAQVSALLADYDKTIAAVEAFAVAFRKLWFAENKPHGFDVQELRLGGLLFRLRSVRDRLAAYADGTCAEIPELAEELLPYAGKGEAGESLPHVNVWSRSVSPNAI